MSNEISRRNRIDLSTPAENSIRDAVQAVEAAGCDVRLTKAINKLHEARELVADFVDYGTIEPAALPSGPATEEK